MAKLDLVRLGLCAAVLAVAACSGPGSVYDRPNSHFDYPNSNVVPVSGPVRVELSEVSFANKVGDPDLERRAVQQALRQYHGDLLINPRYSWSSRVYPLGIQKTTLEVVGVVARMEIGPQVRRETSKDQYR